MNILLICAAGMSTSLLVTKMQEAAKQKGIEANIWAVSADEAKSHLDQADVVLIGPQIRYKLAAFKKEGEARGIPVDVINPADYGRVNGSGVLDFALRLKK
ncbi:PTS sugar transporter subunit IIB [Geobacillus sp. G4]|uniref:Lichenan-specific phosphotransferase enzyme IIB component n=1 Tax=Geobacillus kaustophilus TaxID=1462 RepID=A0A0D8BRI2_GEOKU|nr:MULTISPECIES: PTS sugar transporter subunit IIB [Geobacillus]ALA69040.1 PTS cellbiose transporter subunit IIB [Geobacillus stearothermophilus 10]ADI27178.1 PTS system, lactose/cellobiose family IIB subunit [Geobacillus sp. C56-T3]ADU93724.1 PTS system, lactose/cellobiose family IIB subunit [Geobacillus sp. Y412MC52]AMV10576.1 PTS sugar transporter subunit IIB [Geobacillus thermoleovorans]AOL34174.1 PTS sugar transporter subunit IIB [Geobacillus thermoleovorans]